MAKWDIWFTYGVSIELPEGIDPNDDKNIELVIDTLTLKLSTVPPSELASESQWEQPIKQYIEESNKCDLCLEVSIFETLVKWELLDICSECAEKIQEENQALNRKLDQQ